MVKDKKEIILHCAGWVRHSKNSLDFESLDFCVLNDSMCLKCKRLSMVAPA